MKNKALTESGAKILFSLIPYGGQLLSEIFFDYRSRVKQDRLNNFIESWEQYLKNSCGSGIPLEIQQSEDFGDLFESIVKRVIQTNSTEKVTRFRNVVGNYIAEPIKLDYRDSFLDMIERLNEPQIKILKCHAQITENIRSLLKRREGMQEEMFRLNDKLAHEAELLNDRKPNKYHEHTRNILNIDGHLKEVDKAIKKDGDIRKADYYGLESGDYLFLVQDLYSKGLLVDLGVGTFDTKPFDTMGVTAFGLKFLKFINEEKENAIES
ncbi:hypothetical protein RYH73_25695 [Olivibacter sp. CPCC 100613]|uniref:hypothetical protein n=1 Tax=Olivibacter sp. CPCC 100613 TaxID=3079931 RepID=UPI002FFD06FB